MLFNVFFKLKSFLGLDNPLYILRIGLCLIFGLIPFRLLALFQLHLLERFVIGLFFVFIIFVKSNRLIPYLLNTQIVQVIFFFCLVIDEKFKSLYPFLRIPIFFIILSFLVYILLYIKSLFNFYLVIVFLFSFYKSMKSNFLNLRNPICFTSFRLDLSQSKRDYITWIDVVENMNAISTVAFNKTVVCQLGQTACRIHFTCFTRGIFPRYID